MGLTNNLGKLSNMITSTGSAVGIGTTSPATILDVRGAVGTGQLVTLANTSSYSNSNTLEIGLLLGNSNSGLVQAATIGVTNPAATGNNYGDIYFKTSNTSSPVERLRITSAGNVGIGTSNPTNSLSGDETTLQISNSNVACISLQSTGSGGHKYALGSLGSAGAFGIYDVTAAAYRFQITSSGAVLTPSRPAFRAYYSSNGIWTIVGGGVFNFDSTEYNIGGGFNTSNGSFVAPVAGVYQFNFYTIVLGNYLNAAIAFKKNGSPLASGTNVHFSPYYPANPWNNVVYTTSLYLSAGDYVQMFNIGGTTDFHGRDWSSFSGYLVG